MNITVCPDCGTVYDLDSELQTQMHYNICYAIEEWDDGGTR